MCGKCTKVPCLQELTVGRRQEDKNNPHSGSLLFFFLCPISTSFGSSRLPRAKSSLPHLCTAWESRPMHHSPLLETSRESVMVPGPPPLSGLTLETQRSGEWAQRLDTHLAVEITCVQGCLVTEHVNTQLWIYGPREAKDRKWNSQVDTAFNFQDHHHQEQSWFSACSRGQVSIWLELNSPRWLLLPEMGGK